MVKDFRDQALAAWRHACPGAFPSENPAPGEQPSTAAVQSAEPVPPEAHAAPSSSAGVSHEAAAGSHDSPPASVDRLPGSGKVRKTARKSGAKRPSLTLAAGSAALQPSNAAAVQSSGAAAAQPSDAVADAAEQIAHATIGSTQQGADAEPCSAQQASQLPEPCGGSEADQVHRSVPAVSQIQKPDPVTLIPRGRSRKQAAPRAERPAGGTQHHSAAAQGSTQLDGTHHDSAAVQYSTQQDMKPMQQPTWPENGSAQTSDFNAPEPSDATSPETKLRKGSSLRADSCNDAPYHEMKPLLGAIKLEPGTEGTNDADR